MNPRGFAGDERDFVTGNDATPEFCFNKLKDQTLNLEFKSKYKEIPRPRGRVALDYAV